jgi:hypothetical protein
MNAYVESLIYYMISNNVQRLTINIKSQDGFDQFIKDIRESKQITARRNPINPNEGFVSLGPKSQSKLIFKK